MRDSLCNLCLSVSVCTGVFMMTSSLHNSLSVNIQCQKVRENISCSYTNVFELEICFLNRMRCLIEGKHMFRCLHDARLVYCLRKVF